MKVTPGEKISQKALPLVKRTSLLFPLLVFPQFVTEIQRKSWPIDQQRLFVLSTVTSVNNYEVYFKDK